MGLDQQQEQDFWPESRSSFETLSSLYRSSWPGSRLCHKTLGVATSRGRHRWLHPQTLMRWVGQARNFSLSCYHLGSDPIQRRSRFHRPGQTVQTGASSWSCLHWQFAVSGGGPLLRQDFTPGEKLQTFWTFSALCAICFYSVCPPRKTYIGLWHSSQPATRCQLSSIGCFSACSTWI